MKTDEAILLAQAGIQKRRSARMLSKTDESILRARAATQKRLSAMLRSDTGLVAACLRGDAVMVNELIGSGHDPNLRDNKHQLRPLQAAARVGNIESVSALLAAGANPNIDLKKTPLDEAFGDPRQSDSELLARLPLIRTLLEGGADPRLGTQADLTPLAHAKWSLANARRMKSDALETFWKEVVRKFQAAGRRQPPGLRWASTIATRSGRELAEQLQSRGLSLNGFGELTFKNQHACLVGPLRADDLNSWRSAAAHAWQLGACLVRTDLDPEALELDSADVARQLGRFRRNTASRGVSPTDLDLLAIEPGSFGFGGGDVRWIIAPLEGAELPILFGWVGNGETPNVVRIGTLIAHSAKVFGGLLSFLSDDRIELRAQPAATAEASETVAAHILQFQDDQYLETEAAVAAARAGIWQFWWD